MHLESDLLYKREPVLNSAIEPDGTHALLRHSGGYIGENLRIKSYPSSRERSCPDMKARCKDKRSAKLLDVVSIR